LTIRELIEEQRRRVNSGNPAERLAAALLIPGELTKRLRYLRDFEIGQLLEDEVWSNLNLAAPEATVCMEAVDRLRGNANASLERKRFGTRRRARRSWVAERDAGEHLLHAEAVLYWAHIPHLLLPFQRDKFASNMFMVPSVAEARHCLYDAGFRETPRSPSLLIDGETGRAIRIVEHRN
jgi:hypothetical protein